MKRLVRAIAWLALACLGALSPFLLALLPVRGNELALSHDAGWTGVLRLWKCEGWQSGSGSLTGWLNGRIAEFEKRHPGVYIQLTDVSPETLAAFAAGDVNPPDLLLFAPGMLPDASHLSVLPETMPLRSSLQAVGVESGARHAVPVAMGGYALAMNTELLMETPASWREHPAPTPGPRTASALRKATFSLLNAPADGAQLSWSASLLALFAGTVQTESAAPIPIGDGLDLGLTTPEPTASPAPTAEPQAAYQALPLALPDNFRTQESVYSDFTAGKLSAMPATQREIRRLQLLSQDGRGPDFRIETMGAPFTDQLALMAVVDWPREDGEARQSLSQAFLSHLLTEESQAKLTSARAFPVIDMAPLYGGDSAFAALEQALASPALTVPPVFGDAWRAYAASLMDNVSPGDETAAAYERLQAALSGGA